MKKFQTISAAAVGVAVMTFAAPVAAKIVSADFSATFDLPDMSDGARVFSNPGATVGDGVELDSSHETANPSDWGGFATVDVNNTGLITIMGDRSDGFGDYDLATFTISNIVFDNDDEVLGFVALGQNLFDADFGLGVPAAAIETTANSITFVFDTTEGGDDSDFAFLDGGKAQFQLDLGEPLPAVPLPAGLPLMLLGLGALGVLRARRKAA